MQINVIEYFEKGALLHSREKIAVKEQGREVKFKEVERFAKNCAALILKKTSAKGQPIPVFLPKSAQNIVADIGALYSGNAYANLDVKSPAQRLKGMLDKMCIRDSTTSVLSGNPNLTTSATTNSPAGNYTITNTIGTLSCLLYTSRCV